MSLAEEPGNTPVNYGSPGLAGRIPSYYRAVTLVVNGEERRFDEPLTLEGLVLKLGLQDAPCASELNRALVPKRQRAEKALREGDVVEIVTMVGGG